MPEDEDARTGVERAARAAVGPAARLVRADIRLLAEALRPGEQAEAFGLAATGRFGCTVLVSSQRLLVLRQRRSAREMIVDAAWEHVAVVTLTPDRAVLDVPDGRITLEQLFPGLTFSALGAHAAGVPIEGHDPSLPTGFLDVVRRSLGGQAWLHDDVVTRLARELSPDEWLVAVGEHRELPDGLVALTTDRVGLVPRPADRAAGWTARSAVTRVLVSDRNELVITTADATVRYRIASLDQAGALARELSARSPAGTVPAGPLSDPIAPRLAELADDLERWLGPAAAVERGPGRVTVLPSAPGAVAVGWSDADGHLHLELDRGRAGSMRFRRTERAVTVIGKAIRAVVSGELHTVRGPGRLRTVLHLQPGTLALDEVCTGPAALLPLPGWHRWWPGRRTTYTPYRQA